MYIEAAYSAIAARANDTGTGTEEKFTFYHYTPSSTAAFIFIVLFGLTTLLHLYQLTRTRTWFMIPFCVGGLLEVVGYVGRILSHNQAPDYTLGPFIIQNIALLVAPPFMAASIYMELARIVLMVDGDHALFIRREKLTKWFVCGDVIAFLVQAAGGGMQATAKMQDAGQWIVIVGLVLQLIFFGLFVIAAGLFHSRISKNPTPKAGGLPWKKHLWSMYFVSLLIFVRCLVRVVEFAQGFDGYIISHEIFLYVLDAVPMWLAMATMNWIHPSEVGALIRGTGRMVYMVIRTKHVNSEYRTVQNVQMGPWA